MQICNICGECSFEAGPLGRLSSTGLLPKCSKCLSLERHRAIRELQNLMPDTMLGWRSALQFAPDGSVSADRFARYEGSYFGRTNSIDMQAIDRDDGTYDMILMNHVIEFVPDDLKAFSEILRVSSPRAILQICFASSFTYDAVFHWTEPQGAIGQYHRYGRSLTQHFQIEERGLHAVVARPEDPVTGVREVVHFFCKDPADAGDLRDVFRQVLWQ